MKQTLFEGGLSDRLSLTLEQLEARCEKPMALLARTHRFHVLKHWGQRRTNPGVNEHMHSPGQESLRKKFRTAGTACDGGASHLSHVLSGVETLFKNGKGLSPKS